LKTVKSVRIDGELWRKVKIHCTANGLTISAFIEKLIKNALENSGEKD
jgi:predicted DNA binding CopG/RHH family protein